MRRLAALVFVTVLALCSCAGCGPDLSGEEWDLERVEPEDLGCFDQTYPTGRSQYTLLAGSELEAAVWCLEGEQPGPTVYVVGGLHGDERAGWYAGVLLRKAHIQCGTVYVLAPANAYGAKQNQRTTKSGRDPNRYFPGEEDGWDAQRLDRAVFEDIQAKAPDLLVDLHEANPAMEGRDALGNSLIVENMEGEFGQLVLEMLLASERGELWSGPITLYGSPPEGSINRAVSTQLGIPAVTVETLRSEPLEQRVKNHLELVEYILNRYGMLG